MPDLTDSTSWIKRIIYRLDRLEGGWQLENSSITDGMMTFIRGTLRGRAGALLEWIGTFAVTGTSTLEGPVSITGATGTLDVAADAELHGNTTIGQNLDVTATTRLRGATTVEDDLAVVDGGKFTAGVVLIDGTDGGRIAGVDADLTLVASFGHFIKLLGAAVAESILVNGNLTVLGKATVVDDVELIANLDVPNLPTTIPTGVTAYTVLVGSNGRFYRGPSA